MSNKENSGSYP